VACHRLVEHRALQPHGPGPTLYHHPLFGLSQSICPLVLALYSRDYWNMCLRRLRGGKDEILYVLEILSAVYRDRLCHGDHRAAVRISLWISTIVQNTYRIVSG
jgi:hypothetical protein